MLCFDWLSFSEPLFEGCIIVRTVICFYSVIFWPCTLNIEPMKTASRLPCDWSLLRLWSFIVLFDTKMEKNRCSRLDTDRCWIYYEIPLVLRDKFTFLAPTVLFFLLLQSLSHQAMVVLLNLELRQKIMII